LVNTNKSFDKKGKIGSDFKADEDYI